MSITICGGPFEEEIQDRHLGLSVANSVRSASGPHLDRPTNNVPLYFSSNPGAPLIQGPVSE
jgi:hypothetical protein